MEIVCDGNTVVECCAMECCTMEIVCDGGEEVDETALLRLLALSCNQTLLIILPLHFTYLEYSLFTHIVTLQWKFHPFGMPTRHNWTPAWSSSPHLFSDLLDAVPWPGRGGVPQVCPGLEGAISILLCPPTMCTTLVHLCTCAPMLYMHYLLKKGSVPRTWKCHLCSILSANNCAICLQNCVSCPRKCAQLCQLSASRMCLLWTWQVLQQKQKCGCFSWHTVGDCFTCLRE